MAASGLVVLMGRVGCERCPLTEAFKSWHHYLEGSPFPVDVVMDHKNLEYFATTKVLTQQQAHWSEYLSNFNLIIRFRPGHLSTKLDALTHCPDLYLKEGGKTYGDVNPHNFKPIFSSEQISASLQATSLLPTVLCGVQAMDVEQLNKDILSALSADPSAQSYKADSSNPIFVLDNGL